MLLYKIYIFIVYRPTFPWENFFTKSNAIIQNIYIFVVYWPTFRWENFFKKSNDVSSSEYVDPNDMKDLSLDTDSTGILPGAVARSAECPLRISSELEIPRSDTIFRGKQSPIPLIQEEQCVSY